MSTTETEVRKRVTEALGQPVLRLDELDGGMVGTVHRVDFEAPVSRRKDR